VDDTRFNPWAGSPSDLRRELLEDEDNGQLDVAHGIVWVYLTFSQYSRCSQNVLRADDKRVPNSHARARKDCRRMENEKRGVGQSPLGLLDGDSGGGVFGGGSEQGKGKPKRSRTAAAKGKKDASAQAVKKRGRPTGSKNKDYDEVVVERSRCKRCDSPERTHYYKKMRYKNQTRRWTRCKMCGMCRIDITVDL